MKDKSITYARKRIEKQIEFQEADRKRRLQAQRLELARAGITAYQQRRLAESVRHFLAYIKILEEIKEISPGTLHPRNFDMKADQSELLMISGVYWDLAKLFDRTRSPAKYKEFKGYVEKYIVFSKGMPFQHLCAEAVRKYLTGDKPIHRDEFRHAYKVLSVQQCFIASSLSDYIATDTIPVLQNFRDQRLKMSPFGRAFIRFYYWFGPEAALTLDRLPNLFRRQIAKIVDGIARLCAL